MECGTAFKRLCPQCTTENPLQAKFCTNCGTPFSPPTSGAQASSIAPSPDAPAVAESSGFTAAADFAVPSPPPQPAPEERRQLTVMLCDLVGSSGLAESLDPEDLQLVFQAYQEACAKVVDHFGGYIARYIGDGVLAYFGYPVANEDDASRAVHTGLGILNALPQLNAQLQHEVEGMHDHLLRVRVGIHTGLVVTGEMGGGRFRDPMAIVGETPNIAARLQEFASPDSVLISGATAGLITGLFELEPRGTQPLKGISVPVPVYEILSESGSQRRFEAAVESGLTILVGRQKEIGLLTDSWQQAKEGQGQAVLLSG